MHWNRWTDRKEMDWISRIDKRQRTEDGDRERDKKNKTTDKSKQLRMNAGRKPKDRKRDRTK